MRPISVLFTNSSLGPRGGSETYVRDVALALLRQGHRPVAFSLVHGEMAAELRRATVPVIGDITRLGQPPDVIHGHHHLETLIAALAFPAVPVVNFCHGWIPWEEMPLHHPSVRRYVAIDEVCADRLIREEGLAPSQVDLLLNFVDLSRFKRRAALPDRPLRALVLSNAARATGYAHAIDAACAAAGITLDIVGAAAGNATTAPEHLLAEYDLVFAKGRTALESLAVGCATILADAAGAGPLVAPDNYERLRRRNFGIRELGHAHDVEWYRDQIAQYHAPSCSALTDRVRGDADQEVAIARLLEIYEQAMATPAGPQDPSRAAAIHCSRLAAPLKEAYQLTARVAQLARELEASRQEASADGARHTAEIAADGVRHAIEIAAQARDVGALRDRLAQLERELEASRREAAADDARHGNEIAAEGARHAAEIAAQAREASGLRDRLAALSAEQAGHEAAARDTARQLAAAHQSVEALEHQVAAFQALRTLRLRDALLSAPVVGAALRRVARK